MLLSSLSSLAQFALTLSPLIKATDSKPEVRKATNQISAEQSETNDQSPRKKAINQTTAKVRLPNQKITI
ncbi:hypothetical protein JCM14036_30490 [Desulfotomaculum defluvii]